MKTLVILLALVLSCESQNQILVDTQYGPIRGRELLSSLGDIYLSFQRIPYMKPPIGRLRFRNAEAPDNWTLPLDCTVEGPRFPQIDFTFEPPMAPFAGELDSMHINVFTKNLNPTTRYPVMVWIHGGGFRTGSARTDIYGPEYFMNRDVILVTFNYRLQAFGFLSLDDPTLEIPGNAGMKDQVMALKWIKQNIENFGGDSNNITIFGQSSGGGCAHYHIVSEASKNLFQRSIIMSGSAFNNMYSAVPRRQWAWRLAREINDQIPNHEGIILAFLETADPQAIFTAAGRIMTEEERDDERILNAFGPTIEPYETDTAFMLKHPEELALDSWGNDVDIMIGATSFENGPLVNLMRMFPDQIDLFANFTSYVPSNLGFSAEEREAHGETLRALYYGLMIPSATNPDGVVIMSNDFAFWHSVHRIVKQRWTSGGEGKTFVYRFDVNTENNCFSIRNNVDPIYREPIHMDDICYLFNPSFVTPLTPNSAGWNMTQHMLDIYTQFAATGNPNVAGWIPSTGVNDSAPLFGYNIREVDEYVGELPEIHRMEVWDTFYETGASQHIKAFNLLILVLVMIKMLV